MAATTTPTTAPRSSAPPARDAGAVGPHPAPDRWVPLLTGAGRTHLLTIALEDYYHDQPFRSLIDREEWYRFESRLTLSTRRTLDLLDEFGAKATFFVLGWIADNAPELVHEVVARGHEVASGGYYHSHFEELGPERFREDVARSKQAIERASGQRVVGFRAAEHWLRRGDLWALDVLAEEGYEYDSSIRPFREYAGQPWRRFVHRHGENGHGIWEFPLLTMNVLGCLFPFAGGNYFRQIPRWLVYRAAEQWHRSYDSPFTIYFRTWELDPDQPRLNLSSPVGRLRHYRNLHKIEIMLRQLFERYRFTSIADHLDADLSLASAPAPTRRATAPVLVPEGASVSGSQAWDPVLARELQRPEGPAPVRELAPISVVIPCYNEDLILPYLANTLKSVERHLSARYDPEFVFVDDGSRDDTWAGLHRTFGDRPNCVLVRHDRNQGVAAAILTGIRHARHEVVCSMDCDCTYDPHTLADMIPLLGEGVDLVTASPYHPKGRVKNVPSWRLFLSRGLSAIYRRVTIQKLHTYTSCFRVYRRSAVLSVSVERAGFLGVAEMLLNLDLAGARIVEVPAQLEVRKLGQSKMKTLRTIVGHLGLLFHHCRLRVRRTPAGHGAAARGLDRHAPASPTP